MENGSYDVTLKFAEVFFNQAGQRVFDVSLEGQTVLDDFDIFNEAGGQNIAVDRTFTVDVNDNSLNLDFLASLDKAKVSAIEIKPTPSIKTITGSSDNDTLIGNAEDELIFGLDGNDQLQGREGNDILWGGTGNDILWGQDGNDSIAGEGGNDILLGGLGNDSLNGGEGVDRLQEIADTNFSLTNTQLTGMGTDTFSGFELALLKGGASNNIINAVNTTNLRVNLQGAGGNDTLVGGAMNDTLYGQDGDDVLYGNNDNDTLVGGSGNDTFVLQSLVGRDIIHDFTDGIDLIGLEADLSFGDLSITNNPGGTATLIRDTTNNNQLIAIINNFDAADLTAADFTTI